MEQIELSLGDCCGFEGTREIDLRSGLLTTVRYGTLTEPFPIHAPAAVRMRNATSVALQPAVDELNEPENSALP